MEMASHFPASWGRNVEFRGDEVAFVDPSRVSSAPFQWPGGRIQSSASDHETRFRHFLAQIDRLTAPDELRDTVPGVHTLHEAPIVRKQGEELLRTQNSTLF